MHLLADELTILNVSHISGWQLGSRFAHWGNDYFTRGEDVAVTGWGWYAYFNGTRGGSAGNGAVTGSDNYALIDFDGDQSFGSEFDSVGQFYLDTSDGSGYLIAIATDSDGSITISEGFAAINAVPEPSGALLSLLAVGAAAMSRRRGRRTTRPT
jgi:hypothetical protein